MFSRLAPQKVRHSSGYLVQIASRERVELIERDGGEVHVAAEFGPVSTVYADSIKKFDANGGQINLTDEQKVVLLAQIKAGLEAMGGIYEIV
jgi:hypothetical protein